MRLSVFGFTVYPYGIFCALAVIAMLFGLRYLRGRRDAGRVTLLLLLFGLIGARLLYCAVHLTDYLEGYENPLLMLRFFDGGFSMTGLIGGILLGVLFAAKSAKQQYNEVLDDTAAIVPLSIALLRAGECFTELGVGKTVQRSAVTDALPWLYIQSRMGKAVEIRMNVRVYEIIAAVLIFVLLLCLRKKLSKSKGSCSALFFLLYGAGQTVLDSLRDDGHMMLLFLRVGQLGAVLMLVITFGVTLSKSYRMKKAGSGDVILRSIAMLIGVGLCVALEFSLDGRLTIGKPTLGRDYAIMGVVCLGMLLIGIRTLTETMHAREEMA